MGRSRNKLFGVGLLLGLCAVLCVVLLRRKAEPAWSARVKSQRSSQGHVDSERPSQRPLAGIAADPEEEPSAQSAAVVHPDQVARITRRLLETPIGRLTREEVLKLVEEFLRTPSAREEIQRLMDSSFDVEKVLGVYLKMELDGYSEDILRYAMGQNSPHVRAEVAQWLYHRHEFDTINQYLHGVAGELSVDHVEAVVEALKRTPPRMEVTPLMSRLQLGEGIGLYFRELCGRNDALLQRAAEEFSKPENDHNTRKRMLEALAFVRPEWYLKTLYAALEEPESATITRLMTIQSIAADTSEDEDAVRVDLMRFVPPSPPGVPQPDIRFHTRLVSELRETESLLHNALTAEDPIQAGLAAHLGSYIEQLERLGLDSASAKTFELVAERIDAGAFHIAPAYVDRLEYLQWLSRSP